MEEEGREGRRDGGIEKKERKKRKCTSFFRQECRTHLRQVVPSNCLNSLGQVVITIFRQCDGYTIHFYVFWDAVSESDIKNFES